MSETISKGVRIGVLVRPLLTVGLITFCYLQHVFNNDIIATRDADRESGIVLSQRCQVLEERIVALEVKSLANDVAHKPGSSLPADVRRPNEELYKDIAGGLGGSMSGQGAYGGVPLNTKPTEPQSPNTSLPGSRIPPEPPTMKESPPLKTPKPTPPVPQGGSGINPL